MEDISGNVLTEHKDTTIIGSSQQAVASQDVPLKQHTAPTSTTAEACNVVYTKTKRARPHVLLLIASLAYVITMFAMLSLGTQNMSHYLSPRLHNAQVELRALGNMKYREQMLYNRLDKLLSTQLMRRPMETYEECLARSLDVANEQFFGLGFQYAEIREPTIEWAVDNCARLLYTPQVTSPVSTPQQIILTRWAVGTYRARLVATKMYHMVLYTWMRFVDEVDSHLRSIYPLPVDYQSDGEDHDLEPAPGHLGAKMPFGFSLDCDGSSLCRPIYDQIPDKVTISNEIMETSIRKVQELGQFCDKLEAFRHLMASISLFFVPFELLCLLAHSILSIYLFMTAPPRHSQSMNPPSTVKRSLLQLTKEEKYTVMSIAIQLGAMIFCFTEERRKSRGRTGDMFFGIGFWMTGFMMLVNMFFPAEQFEYGENVFNIWKTIKELYVLATSSHEEDVAQPVHAQVLDEAKSQDKELITGRQSQQKVEKSTPIDPDMSSSSTPQISLDITLQEEFRAELDFLRRKPQQQAYVESVSDVSSEDEGFVDLAGGITATTTEVDSDWSVVDA
ncbi:hypothetical protein FB567DRAFT_516447 [Paraphoma chrysanthemicola]|uniref:Uncharacterized protein n=1 Tax=Paraphoma chrysanthemicola TaxID=798071 RepID=A0A8K0RF72_9PLEO|nr:hypothetical protein FB567DRAFT_516447 [Paraphoma chrysanthemicola]